MVCSVRRPSDGPPLTGPRWRRPLCSSTAAFIISECSSGLHHQDFFGLRVPPSTEQNYLLYLNLSVFFCRFHLAEDLNFLKNASCLGPGCDFLKLCLNFWYLNRRCWNWSEIFILLCLQGLFRKSSHLKHQSNISLNHWALFCCFLFSAVSPACRGLRGRFTWTHCLWCMSTLLVQVLPWTQTSSCLHETGIFSFSLCVLISSWCSSGFKWIVLYFQRSYYSILLVTFTLSSGGRMPSNVLAERVVFQIICFVVTPHILCTVITLLSHS